MANAGHEAMEDHHEVEGPSDRSFGLTVGGILLAIGLVRLFVFDAGTTSTIALMAPGALLVLLALIRPALLGPLNTAWAKLGLLLARIVNPIIMGLMYFLIFVPLGLAMKLCGRDALRMKRPVGQDTYWIERSADGFDPETMKNQF